MANDNTFVEFLLDQLASLPAVRAKRMFGGHGVYSADVFFAIVHEDRVYFKTNEKTRGKYLDEEMEPFMPSAKQTIKTYYEVPPHVVEDDETLVEWAREAIETAASQP